MSAELSIIIPFYNEELNVRAVIDEIINLYPTAEIIAVDDGSHDGTWQEMTKIAGIRAFRFEKNRGQSGAVYWGLKQATRTYCVTMDGDGQNDPADIQHLLAVAKNCDVVCGKRRKRQDNFSRKVASRIGNGVRNLFLHDGIADTGCSLKLFRTEYVEHLVPFNGLHRFLPAIFKGAGLNLREVEVNHRPRQRGVSKYSNLDRALRGIYDLVGVSWLIKRKITFNSKAIMRHE